MKKTLKIAAFVAAAMIGFGFVSCANDDAEDLGTLLIVKDYQEKKEAEAAAAAAAAKAASSSSSGEASSSLPSPYTLDLAAVAKKGKMTSSTDNKLDDTVSFLVGGSKNMQGYATFINMSGNALSYTTTLEYGVKLTLSNKADVVIKALTKESTTLNSGDDPITGQWGLVDASAAATATAPTPKYTSTGTPVVATQKGGSDTDPGVSSAATLTFSDVAAGTYVLGGIKKGGYLYSLVITYKE